MSDEAVSLPLAHYQIIRRNGAVVPFEPNKVAVEMMKAFLAVHGTQGATAHGSREELSAAVMLVRLRTEYLSRFREGATLRATLARVARHRCELKARRRRPRRHGLRPVNWHWRVHDG
jgi:hypothetical protein